MRKYKKTIIGAMILLLLTLASCLYSFYGPADFNKQTFIRDEHANIIGRAPFPPSKEHWLGTDRNGQDMHLLLLFGAKFTLLTTFGVALLRVLIGGLLGLFFSLWAPGLKKYFNDFFLAFRYVPSILLGIILMLPIALVFKGVNVYSIITYQFLILVLIGIPSVTIFTADIANEFKKMTFIQCSYLMGATHFHIIRRQLMPYIRSYGLLFFVQQILSTLQVMMHLGIFELYLGGPTQSGMFGYDDPPKNASFSNEWAGLIGQNFNEFRMAPWAVFAPVICFFIVIFIVNMMKKEIEEIITGTHLFKKKVKRKKEVPLPQELKTVRAFEFVEQAESSHH